MWMRKLPKIGDRIETWFSDTEDGMSTVMAVEPYQGRYPEFFTHVVRASAPRTWRGWMEFTADVEEERRKR